MSTLAVGMLWDFSVILMQTDLGGTAGKVQQGELHQGMTLLDKLAVCSPWQKMEKIVRIWRDQG